MHKLYGFWPFLAFMAILLLLRRIDSLPLDKVARTYVGWVLVASLALVTAYYLYTLIWPLVEERRMERERPDSPAAEPEPEREQIFVQYRMDGWGNRQGLAKMQEVQQLLEQTIEGKNLGFVDGNDYGSGKFNVFCYVNDVAEAKPIMQDALSARGLLQGALIIHGTKEGLKAIYPEAYSGPIDY